MKPTLISAAVCIAYALELPAQSPPPISSPGVRAAVSTSMALDVASGIGQLTAQSWQRESRLGPSFRLTHGAGYLAFDAIAAERGGELFLRRSAADAAVSTPAFGVFRFSATGHYLRDASRSSASASSMSLGASASARVGAGGVWTGAQSDRYSGPRITAGAWHVLRGAIISFAAHDQSMRVRGRLPFYIRDSIFNDTTGGWNYYQRHFGDSSVSRMQRWSDVEGRVDWAMGRLAVSAAMSGRRGGMRATGDSTRDAHLLWGRATAALQLNDRMSIVATAGSSPTAGGAGVATARFVTIGLRLSPVAMLRPPLPAAVRPSASAFRVDSVSPGTYRIIVRVPSARTVELSGDFNAWTAVALRESAPNQWEAMVQLAPGTHRVSVRVDGDRWTAPPGLPSVDDEFSGSVGLLVVR